MVTSAGPLVTGASLLVGLLGVLFGWLTSRRKSHVDESALILGKWKELVDTHEGAIKRLTDEFASYRATAREEVEALRKRLKEVEEEFASYRKSTDEHLRKKDDEIRGLKRAIGQNSRSTAFRLGGLEVHREKAEEARVAKEDQDALDKLNKAGDNSLKGVDDGTDDK